MNTISERINDDYVMNDDMSDSEMNGGGDSSDVNMDDVQEWIDNERIEAELLYDMLVDMFNSRGYLRRMQSRVVKSKFRDSTNQPYMISVDNAEFQQRVGLGELIDMSFNDSDIVHVNQILKGLQYVRSRVTTHRKRVSFAYSKSEENRLKGSEREYAEWSITLDTEVNTYREVIQEAKSHLDELDKSVDVFLRTTDAATAALEEIKTKNNGSALTVWNKSFYGAKSDPKSVARRQVTNESKKRVLNLFSKIVDHILLYGSSSLDDRHVADADISLETHFRSQGDASNLEVVDAIKEMDAVFRQSKGSSLITFIQSFDEFAFSSRAAEKKLKNVNSFRETCDSLKSQIDVMKDVLEMTTTGEEEEDEDGDDGSPFGSALGSRTNDDRLRNRKKQGTQELVVKFFDDDELGLGADAMDAISDQYRDLTSAENTSVDEMRRLSEGFNDYVATVFWQRYSKYNSESKNSSSDGCRPDLSDIGSAVPGGYGNLTPYQFSVVDYVIGNDVPGVLITAAPGSGKTAIGTIISSLHSRLKFYPIINTTDAVMEDFKKEIFISGADINIQNWLAVNCADSIEDYMSTQNYPVVSGSDVVRFGMQILSNTLPHMSSTSSHHFRRAREINTLLNRKRFRLSTLRGKINASASGAKAVCGMGPNGQMEDVLCNVSLLIDEAARMIRDFSDDDEKSQINYFMLRRRIWASFKRHGLYSKRQGTDLNRLSKSSRADQAVFARWHRRHVRVILMTATPVNDSPVDLLLLLALTQPPPDEEIRQRAYLFEGMSAAVVKKHTVPGPLTASGRPTQGKIRWTSLKKVMMKDYLRRKDYFENLLHTMSASNFTYYNNRGDTKYFAIPNITRMEPHIGAAAVRKVEDCLRFERSKVRYDTSRQMWVIQNKEGIIKDLYEKLLDEGVKSNTANKKSKLQAFASDASTTTGVASNSGLGSRSRLLAKSHEIQRLRKQAEKGDLRAKAMLEYEEHYAGKRDAKAINKCFRTYAMWVTSEDLAKYGEGDEFLGEGADEEKLMKRASQAAAKRRSVPTLDQVKKEIRAMRSMDSNDAWMYLKSHSPVLADVLGNVIDYYNASRELLSRSGVKLTTEEGLDSGDEATFDGENSLLSAKVDSGRDKSIKQMIFVESNPHLKPPHMPAQIILEALLAHPDTNMLDVTGSNVRKGEAEASRIGVATMGIKKGTLEDVKERFNDISNTFGTDIGLVILTGDTIEGLNLMSVGAVHAVGPFTNGTDRIQAVGRAIRHCSHRNIPKEAYRNPGVNSIEVINYMPLASISQTVETITKTTQKGRTSKEIEQVLEMIPNLGFTHKLFGQTPLAVEKDKAIKDGGGNLV